MGRFFEVPYSLNFSSAQPFQSADDSAAKSSQAHEDRCCISQRLLIFAGKPVDGPLEYTGCQGKVDTKAPVLNDALTLTTILLFGPSSA